MATGITPRQTTSTLPPTDWMSIARAEELLNLCAKCEGAPCRRLSAQYLQPVIKCGHVDDLTYCPHYQPPTKPVAKPIISNAAEAVAFAKEQLIERRRQNLPILEARYGVALTPEEYAAVSRAECDLSYCTDCKGVNCVKNRDRYFQPKIAVSDGHIQIETSKCPMWDRIRREKALWAGIPPKYIDSTFADYEITADNRRAHEAAQWFLRKPRREGLFVYGGAGTGKTFLASLIALEKLPCVVFGDVPLLLTNLKRTFDQVGVSTAQIFDKYKQTPLLVLDDFGAGKITDWTVDVLYQIVNDRYNNRLPTIVTSNYDLDGLQRRLSQQDEFGGQRITSRLREMCNAVFTGTTDRRQ